MAATNVSEGARGEDTEGRSLSAMGIFKCFRSPPTYMRTNEYTEMGIYIYIYIHYDSSQRRDSLSLWQWLVPSLLGDYYRKNGSWGWGQTYLKEWEVALHRSKAHPLHSQK
jgi:hypothetical protein